MLVVSYNDARKPVVLHVLFTAVNVTIVCFCECNIIMFSYIYGCVVQCALSDYDSTICTELKKKTLHYIFYSYKVTPQFL